MIYYDHFGKSDSLKFLFIINTQNLYLKVLPDEEVHLVCIEDELVNVCVISEI